MEQTDCELFKMSEEVQVPISAKRKAKMAKDDAFRKTASELAKQRKTTPAQDRITKKGKRVGGSKGLELRRGR